MLKRREIWKPVPSLEQIHASSRGRVRIQPYQMPMPKGGGVSNLGGRETWGRWSRSYKRHVFQHKHKTYIVARLVCAAFHGPPPPDKPFCMHIDEDAANNIPSNLKWGTKSENQNMPKYVAICRSNALAQWARQKTSVARR